MKNKIDYSQIIKDKIDIVDMLSRELNLIKSGDNYKALCPFHEEKTPSFTVNTKKQNYVCYGCGKNGDIFSYVMEKYKINFKEALEKLAKDANIKLNATLYNSSKGSYSNSKYYFKVMNDIALYYNSNLKKFLANNNISFLEKKKITNEKIEKYNLGLSDNSDKLEKFLAKTSVSLDYLIENNIFKINKFEKKFDLFTNRIMFPIKDRFENTIAFGGRTLSEEKPKYINSWENRFFKKRMTLYNLPSLNRIKKRSEEVYIVEGYTDVIAMESKGMKAIAPLGTSLSIEQFKLVWKFVNEPTLLMDGDEAGINASSRALDLILHAKLLKPLEAHNLGIINKLLTEKKFKEELDEYCEDLVNRAPIALSQVKKIIHQGLEMSLEDSLLLEQKAFDVTMNSKDAARAMRSLLNAQENIENEIKFEWKGE